MDISSKKPAQLIVTGGTIMMGTLDDGHHYPVFSLAHLLLAKKAFEAYGPQAEISADERAVMEEFGHTKESLLKEYLGTGADDEDRGRLLQTAAMELHNEPKAASKHGSLVKWLEKAQVAALYAVAFELDVDEASNVSDDEIQAFCGTKIEESDKNYADYELKVSLYKRLRTLMDEYHIHPKVLNPYTTDSLNFQTFARGEGAIEALGEDQGSRKQEFIDAGDQLEKLYRSLKQSLDSGNTPIVVGGTDTLDFYFQTACEMLRREGYFEHGEHSVISISAMDSFQHNPGHVVKLLEAAAEIGDLCENNAIPAGPVVLSAADAEVNTVYMYDALQPLVKISGDSRMPHSFRGDGLIGVYAPDYTKKVDGHFSANPAYSESGRPALQGFAVGEHRMSGPEIAAYRQEKFATSGRPPLAKVFPPLKAGNDPEAILQIMGKLIRDARHKRRWEGDKDFNFEALVIEGLPELGIGKNKTREQIIAATRELTVLGIPVVLVNNRIHPRDASESSSVAMDAGLESIIPDAQWNGEGEENANRLFADLKAAGAITMATTTNLAYIRTMLQLGEVKDRTGLNKIAEAFGKEFDAEAFRAGEKTAKEYAPDMKKVHKDDVLPPVAIQYVPVLDAFTDSLKTLHTTLLARDVVVVAPPSGVISGYIPAIMNRWDSLNHRNALRKLGMNFADADKEDTTSRLHFTTQYAGYEYHPPNEQPFVEETKFEGNYGPAAAWASDAPDWARSLGKISYQKALAQIDAERPRGVVGR